MQDLYFKEHQPRKVGKTLCSRGMKQGGEGGLWDQKTCCYFSVHGPNLELTFPERMLGVRPDGDGCRISLMVENLVCSGKWRTPVLVVCCCDMSLGWTEVDTPLTLSCEGLVCRWKSPWDPQFTPSSTEMHLALRVCQPAARGLGVQYSLATSTGLPLTPFSDESLGDCVWAAARTDRNT